MRVSYEGDGTAAQEFLGKAQQELFRLEQRMATYGREQGTFHHALTPDAYCFGYVLPGGIRAIHIVAPPAPIEDVPGIPVKSHLPDFVSGVIDRGHIIKGDSKTPDKMQFIYPTLPSYQLHPKEFPVGPLLPNESARLVVLPGGGFDDLGPPTGSTVIYSQTTKLHASMYSGKMRKVVQLLMGFGRIPKKSIYDGVKPLLDLEKQHAKTAADTPSAWETVVKRDGRQVWYDYRFPRTHGVVTATDGSLWLCEIGFGHGVCVMPLPIDKHTQDPKFRQKLNNIGDTDGLAALDEFGGYPTGETFAPGRGFDAYIRAGRIVQMLKPVDLESVYTCDPYSQAMGWAFNESGSEAHNTGWTFEDDETDKVQRGVHWSLNLRVAPDVATMEPHPGADSMRRAFEKLRADIRYADVFEANMWKIDRLEHDDYMDIQSLLGTYPLDLLFEKLDALIGRPVATATASLAEVSRGKIYWPTKIQPQIKFPDYSLGFLVSHDMRPSGHVDEAVRCDTTMHVFFVGNELKWCKFFNDPRTAPTRKEGDEDEDILYNPVGNFAQTFTTGPIGIPAMFYTNELDDRAELGSAVATETYRRRDHGWIAVVRQIGGFGSPSGVHNNAGPLNPDFNEGGASENHKLVLAKFKWFSYEQWHVLRNTPSLQGAIIVPFFDRCAYYYARFSGHGGGNHSYSYGTGAMSSPYIGHWFRETGETLTDETQELTPDGDVWSRYWDIADEGDWVPHGTPVSAAEYGAAAFGNLGAQGRSTFDNDPPVLSLAVYLCASKSQGVLPTYAETRAGASGAFWEPAWFQPSPDEFGFTQYIQETQTCFGKGDAIVYQQDVTQGEQKVAGSPQLEVMRSHGNSLPLINFVGVIDG